jgi:aspartate-semialdehyde dehydrogenase
MRTSKTRVALVGADTLLGREIKDVVESTDLAAVDSFSANGEANFGEEEGEAVFREALEPRALEHTSIIISAGSPEGAEKALAIARAQGGKLKLIDCTGELDQQPEARIYGLDEEPPRQGGWLFTLAHPAAGAISVLLRKLAKERHIARAIVEVFEPASERGRLGLAELQQQTTGLLSFRPLDKKVYDTQVSFAMVPAYGEGSSYKLDAIEGRIEKHLATLLSRSGQQGIAVAMPSLRLIQAPVFHGYTFSAWIEFEETSEIGSIVGSLRSDLIDVRTAEHEPPTNVAVAGQSGLTVGDIRIDRNNSRAIWLWAAADNFRIVADEVNELIESWEMDAK